MPELNQEELDQIKNDLRIAKFQLQAINDNLQGGLTSRNLSSFRNTYVINAQDSLDATYPLYVHFNIINEMIKIVSVKVSFWILNYRAYSTAAASGGAVSSASGGGETPTSSAGGVVTSEAPSSTYENLPKFSLDDPAWPSVTNVGTENESGRLPSGAPTMVIVARGTHTHIGGSHTHTVTVAAHTHTGGAHTHGITYGIFEDSTSPKIKFYLSENEGISYNDRFFGNYDTDKKDLEITSLLTGAGSKLVKFESTTRARLSVQIEIKLDIKAR